MRKHDNCKPKLQFGPFQLDLRSAELRKHGQIVRLEPQPYRVLEVLVSHQGQVVTRQELRDAVWSTHTQVQFDQGLNYCIRQIRAALGTTPLDREYLETLPKRGYRFLAQVLEIPEYPDIAVIPSLQSNLRRPWILRLLLATLALLVFSLFIWAIQPSPRTVRTIIVRPFTALGPDGRLVTDAHSLTQQSIAALAKNSAFRVLPWANSLGLHLDTGASNGLGRRYNADAIFDGVVYEIDGRLVLEVKLVAAATGAVLWSKTSEGNDAIRSMIRSARFFFPTPKNPIPRPRVVSPPISVSG